MAPEQKRSEGTRLAIIGGVFSLVAALIGGAFMLANTMLNLSAKRTPSSAITVVITAAAPAPTLAASGAILPAATVEPPAATSLPPTATGEPPAATAEPPTMTAEPPTPTAEPPTPTAEPPTATPLPPTPSAPADVLVEALAWPLIFYDRFDTDDGTWPTGDFATDRITGTRTIVDGMYYMEGTALEGVTSEAIAGGVDLPGDFYYACDVQNVGLAKSVDYGLMFRESDAGFYTLGITDDQDAYSYVIYGGRWIKLSGTAFSSIRPQEANRLAVAARGARYYFYINGEYVVDVTDDKLPAGGVGLQFSLDEAGDAGAYLFDNCEVRAP